MPAEQTLETGKYANTLMNFGVHRGDRVFFLQKNSTELQTGIQAALDYGAVAGVLSCDSSTDAWRADLHDHGVRLLIVDAEFKSRIDPIRKVLPELWQVLVVTHGQPFPRMGAGDFVYEDYFAAAETTFRPVVRRPEESLVVEGPCGERASAFLQATGPGKQVVNR